VELNFSHDFLVLASDGLWDAVDDESAVEWISDRKEEGWFDSYC
jgi:serine/threonine protein phosphatase PrpC